MSGKRQPECGARNTLELKCRLHVGHVGEHLGFGHAVGKVRWGLNDDAASSGRDLRPDRDVAGSSSDAPLGGEVAARTDDHEGLTNNAPIWRPTIDQFIAEQILEMVPEGQVRHACYRLTPRGRVFVEAMMSLPLPKARLTWTFELPESWTQDDFEEEDSPVAASPRQDQEP